MMELISQQYSFTIRKTIPIVKLYKYIIAKGRQTLLEK